MPTTDYAQMVREAQEAAALRRFRGMRPPGGPSRRPSRSSEDTFQRFAEFAGQSFVPHTPLDVGLMMAGGPFSLPTKAAAVALGTMLDPTEAKAGPAAAVRKLLPDMIQQLTGKDAAKEFHAAVAKAKEAHPQGAAVELKSPKAYAAEGVKLFTSPDKSTGFAIIPPAPGRQGPDLVSVFKHPDSPYVGAGPALTRRAVQEGAQRLDAFDTILPDLYSREGFRAVGRIPFNPKFKPEGWRKADFPYAGIAPDVKGAVRGKGQPDVVAMVADPRPGAPYLRGEGIPTHGYENLQALQEAALTGRYPQQFLPTARQALYPGIYKDPRQIAREAAAAYAPEDPALKRLFGVTRGDLAEMAQERVRKFGEGELPPPAGMVQGPRARGSEAARSIMTPENTQRIVDNIAELQKASPQMVEGMLGWSVQDPLFKRMVEVSGKKQALEDYPFFNTMQAMASPGSDVSTEINRGTAAAMLARQGRFEDFIKYAGGRNPTARTYVPGAPEDMADILGHIYHKTSQAEPMRKFLQSGRIMSEDVKVPTYAGATGVPQTGFSWQLPIGDTHWAGGVGLPDVRTGRTFAGQKGSVSPAELATVAPWWKRDIADQFGWTPAQTQHVTWAGFGPQTGVDTLLGAPKLELQAKRIMKRAEKTGQWPENVRDLGLQFREHWAVPFTPAGALAPYYLSEGEREY